MTVKIIEERIKTYNPISVDHEEQALKEILQEIALISESCFLNLW